MLRNSLSKEKLVIILSFMKFIVFTTPQKFLTTSGKVFRAHNIKSINDLKDENSLYIRDTGGQVKFQESLILIMAHLSLSFNTDHQMEILSITINHPFQTMMLWYSSYNVSAIDTMEVNFSRKNFTDCMTPSCIYSWYTH